MENINSLAVVDLTGKVLLQHSVKGQISTSINLENLKAGIYFIVLNDNSGLKITRKIVKQ